MRRKHKYHRDEVRELEAIKDNTMTTTKPNPATEPTLEPCPFCGGPAEKRLTDGPKRGFIGCFTCMIGLPFNAPYGDTEVAAWNFRAPTNAPPLCPVHASLDSTDELELEIGNDCIACSLNQRTEMLKILEPHVPAGEQVDAVEFLRAKLAPASAAPIKHYFCSCGGALTAEEYITHYFELGHDRGDPAVAAIAAPVVESPILAFHAWLERWVVDNGRKLTQDEYGIAYAAFIAAHPGEGPKAQVMAAPLVDNIAIRDLFALLEQDSRGQWCFKSLSRDAAKFQSAISRLAAAATAAPQTKSCGFCGKSDQEVKVLIQAPVGYICDECVAVCAGIIERERTAAPVEQSESQ